MPVRTLFETSPQENRPSAEDWSYEFVDNLSGGVNTASRDKALDPSQSIVAENIRFAKEEVLSDLGYVTFGQVIVGSPRATYEYHRKSGTSVLTLITNTRFYRWNSSVGEWQFVSSAVKTTLTLEAGVSHAGAIAEFPISGAPISGGSPDRFVFVADITGFSDGDEIVIALDDGTQHVTTIDGTPVGVTINLATAVPSTAASGSAVFNSVILTGTDDIQPSMTTWAGTDSMYFVNGVDVVKKYDGTNVSNVSGLPAATKARVIIVHVNQLILMNTEEIGTAHPQRERWSEIGDDTAWDTSVNFNDHLDTEDHIMAAEILGVYLIIYKERSIIRQEYVGSADQQWHWVTVINGEGTASADAVVSIRDEHIFWGNSNIYKYRGGFDIESIGDALFDGVFSAISGNINPAGRERIFGLYVEELDEVWFLYPHGANAYPKRMARGKLSTNAWSFRNFTFNVTGFGFFSTSATITWANAMGTWAEQVGPWVKSSLQAEAPTVHLCDGSDLRVYDYNFGATKDNTVDIPYILETKDWFVPNRELRFDRYDIEMKGTTVLVEISVNEGKSYRTLGTVSPGTSFDRERFYQQVVGRKLRFRFSGDKDFGVRELGFLYKRESIQP